MSQYNYLSLPLNEDFQPIEIQLQNHQKNKDIDFKLIVLLILIIMLGILIRKEQQQLDIQVGFSVGRDGGVQGVETINDGVQISEQQQQQPFRQEQKKYTLLYKREQVNQFYNNDNNSNLQKQHQISSNNKIASINNNHQETQEYHHQIQHSIASGQNYQPSRQQQLYPNDENDNNGNINNDINRNQHQLSHNYKSSIMKSSITTTTTTINTIPTTTPAITNTHSKLLKKYIEFYLWFPLFIFALIVYSCYEKQSTQSHILISVKTLGQQQCQSQQINQCAICITEITCNDPLAVLPCSQKHAFHSRCIKEWLLQKKTCPICRSDVRRRFKNLQK